jgi:hypothetical protein
MKTKFAGLMLILLTSGMAFQAFGQTDGGKLKTGLLQARHRDDEGPLRGLTA